jgi:hypothetical protein
MWTCHPLLWRKDKIRTISIAFSFISSNRLLSNVELIMTSWFLARSSSAVKRSAILRKGVIRHQMKGIWAGKNLIDRLSKVSSLRETTLCFRPNSIRCGAIGSKKSWNTMNNSSCYNSICINFICFSSNSNTWRSKPLTLAILGVAVLLLQSVYTRSMRRLLKQDLKVHLNPCKSS